MTGPLTMGGHGTSSLQTNFYKFSLDLHYGGKNRSLFGGLNSSNRDGNQNENVNQMRFISERNK